ncbi:MAG: glycosyltransferase [Alphaproteobacteria bacterium]
MRLCYVGVMAAQDGVDGLLRISHYLKNNLKKDFELILMGDGPKFSELKKQTKELELEKNINFLGFVSQEKITEELSNCDIGITPDFSSPMNDYSTMLKVMDYMSYGLPQVMYNLTENKATAGDAALYVEPGNEKEFAEKIAQLIDDEQLRNKLGKTAAERIKSLTWEQCGSPALLKAVEKL